MKHILMTMLLAAVVGATAAAQSAAGESIDGRRALPGKVAIVFDDAAAPAAQGALKALGFHSLQMVHVRCLCGAEQERSAGVPPAIMMNPFPDCSEDSACLVAGEFWNTPPGASVAQAVELAQTLPGIAGAYAVSPHIAGLDPFADVIYGDYFFMWPTPGDPNHDGRIDLLDMIFVRNRFGASVASGDAWAADVNGDGAVNILDVIGVRNHMGANYTISGQDYLWSVPASFGDGAGQAPGDDGAIGISAYDPKMRRLIPDRIALVARSCDHESVDPDTLRVFRQQLKELSFETVLVQSERTESYSDTFGRCEGPGCWSYAEVWKTPPGMTAGEATELAGPLLPAGCAMDRVASSGQWYNWETCWDGRRYLVPPQAPWMWPTQYDANYDGKTNVLDMIYVRNRLGGDVETGDTWLADINRDGAINAADIIALRNHLGENHTVPESWLW